jgi:Holliday junction resolvase RusA-like endonuclease
MYKDRDRQSIIYAIKLHGRNSNRSYLSELRRIISETICSADTDCPCRALGMDDSTRWEVELDFYTSRSALDIDNLVKPVLDALTGMYWKDDRQVYRIVANKHYCADMDGFSYNLRLIC